MFDRTNMGRGEIWMMEVLEESHKESETGPQGFALHSVVVLWTARRRLVKIALGAAILAISIVFLIPSRYESSATLMPPDQDQQTNLAPLMAMAGNGALAGIAGNVLGVKNTSDLFTEILRSRSVEDRVIDQNRLCSVYGSRDSDSARLALSRRTTFSVDRKTGIISITVQDRSPQRASEIAQSYITALNAVVNLSSTSSARRQREFIEQRLKEVKHDLDTAAHDLGDFSSKNRTLDVKDQGRAEMELAGQLQGALANAQSELEALRQEYAPDNVRVRMAQCQGHTAKNRIGEAGRYHNDGTGARSRPQGSGCPQLARAAPPWRQLRCLLSPVARAGGPVRNAHPAV